MVVEVELFVSVKLHMFGDLEVVLGGTFDGGCQGKSQVSAAAGNGGCQLGFGCVRQVDGVAFGAVCVGLGCCGAEVLSPGDIVVKEYIVGGGFVALALAFEEAA